MSNSSQEHLIAESLIVEVFGHVYTIVKKICKNRGIYDSTSFLRQKYDILTKVNKNKTERLII
ncbi:hypothetical protein HMI01_08850 [Halolactibacillus miurensis]|uniref:Uncharacterized protein n=1 Tax=Halolactibacillus miurensis TaxID=306541 RepID=A0ABQ0VRV2_9BACI|nr:hypothetical protein HMI01_08850 [Halolactibacillus miurensis]